MKLTNHIKEYINIYRSVVARMDVLPNPIIQREPNDETEIKNYPCINSWINMHTCVLGYYISTGTSTSTSTSLL